MRRECHALTHARHGIIGPFAIGRSHRLLGNQEGDDKIVLKLTKGKEQTQQVEL